MQRAVAESSIVPRGATGSRVVFFLQGERVPAARFQWSSDRDGTASGRHGLRGQRLVAERLWRDEATLAPAPPRPLYVPVSFVRRFDELRNLRDDDVVVFQRPMSAILTLALERRPAAGRKTIFDFDDAIFMNSFSRRKICELVEIADVVIAGNSYLAAATGAPTKNDRHSDVVDTDRFRRLPSSSERRAQTSSWDGPGGSNTGHLALGSSRDRSRARAHWRSLSKHPGPTASEGALTSGRRVRPVVLRP